MKSQLNLLSITVTEADAEQKNAFVRFVTESPVLFGIIVAAIIAILCAVYFKFFHKKIKDILNRRAAEKEAEKQRAYWAERERRRQKRKKHK